MQQRATRTRPKARRTADARQVVANPEQYVNRPLLRRMAWAILMSERGHSVDQARLSRMPVEGVAS